jgi:hypothetical protein
MVKEGGIVVKENAEELTEEGRRHPSFFDRRNNNPHRFLIYGF